MYNNRHLSGSFLAFLCDIMANIFLTLCAFYSWWSYGGSNPGPHDCQW